MEAAASEDLLEQKVHELDARLRQMKEERDQVSFNFRILFFFLGGGGGGEEWSSRKFIGAISILFHEIYFSIIYL